MELIVALGIVVVAVLGFSLARWFTRPKPRDPLHKP